MPRAPKAATADQDHTAEPAAKQAAAKAPARSGGSRGSGAAAATETVPAGEAPAGEPPARAAAKGDKWLASQRTLLLKERDSYMRQAESLKAEADALAEDMEPGDVQFDEESGEGMTVNIERERDLALSAQARAAVEEIERALAKIAAGTYGVCERCGQPIPRDRLKAIPQAALCVQCKSGGLLRR